MITRPLASFALIFESIASTAIGAPAPSAQPAQPNATEERICETIIMTGSRLGKKKICATRAEWAERRRQDRDVTEGFQTLRRNPCNSVNQDKGAGNC